MWFLFGFITFLSFAVFAGYKRINASWKGLPGNVGGVSYRYRVIRSKYGITGVLIGIDGAPGYEYRFKAESSVDRFFKTIGLSVEHEIGNREFDEQVYVVSDDERFHRQISLNKSIVESVLGIFGSGKDHKCRTKEIRNNCGRLWARCKTEKGFDEGRISALAADVVPYLQTINNELTRIPSIESSRWRDPFVVKAAVLLAISTGLAINGVVHLMRLVWTNVPFTVDVSELLVASAWWGLGIIGALVLVTLLLLGRTARTHLVLIELLLVGSFGAVSTAFTELRDVNIELDQSQAIEYHVKTLDKRISRGRRRSTSYYLYLEGWNRETFEEKVKVSRLLYNTIAVGDSVSIRQNNGYLGYRWVESIRKRP